MEFTYKKNKNKQLFRTLEKEKFGNFRHLQNYIPLYCNFFSLNETNWNSINLNSVKYILDISKKNTENEYEIVLNNKEIVNSYFKLAPLIDPVKYMIGKYNDISLNITEILPIFNKKQFDKIEDSNNVAYTDGFFTFLSSKLKEKYNNPHCIDFYGSYIGIKQNYKINIFDDIEYLYDSPYFLENVNNLFTLNGEIEKEFLNFNTRKNKEKLKFDKTIDILSIASDNEEAMNEVFENNNENSNEIIQLSDISNLEEYIIKVNSENENKNENKDETKSISTSSSGSTCSSRTSTTSQNTNTNTNTNSTKISNETTIENDDKTTISFDENSDIDSDSDNHSEYLEAEIEKFPVQIISMEKLTMTLDKYMEENDISKEEWLSIFMQIFMNILTYRKAFNFTHNDLHTNNIMLNETEQKYLYYKYNNVYYKVPTYGKIYKIIDFGRAIYSFREKLIMSDSYHNEGDAATQFNFGPYKNENKPIVEPNYAFDICRLGCSLYDNFIDNEEHHEDKNEEQVNNTETDSMNEYNEMMEKLKDIINLIKEWTTDDNGKNVLYKSSGKERYPGFKLYKMITRTVHKHTPEEQLKKDIFKQFVINTCNIKEDTLVNIDIIKSEI